MKYIDADKLIEGIKHIQSKFPVITYEALFHLITSLQQEQTEVDLEKEIQEHIKECLDVKFPTTDIELIKKDVAYTAKKFYELGLNARKEK